MSYWNPQAEQVYNQILDTRYTGALARSFNETSGFCPGIVGTGLATRPGQCYTLSLRVRGSPVSPGGRSSVGYQTRVVRLQSVGTKGGA